MNNEFLWVEKYRPKTIDDCVLPAQIKTTFKQIVEKGELHNMLLTGTAGLGKTTVAKALCNELDFTLNEVAEENLEKLNNRLSRGKISGSGDDR